MRDASRQQQRPLIPDSVVSKEQRRQRAVRAQRSGEVPGTAHVQLGSQKEGGGEEEREIAFALNTQLLGVTHYI